MHSSKRERLSGSPARNHLRGRRLEHEVLHLPQQTGPDRPVLAPGPWFPEQSLWLADSPSCSDERRSCCESWRFVPSHPRAACVDVVDGLKGARHRVSISLPDSESGKDSYLCRFLLELRSEVARLTGHRDGARLVFNGKELRFAGDVGPLVTAASNASLGQSPVPLVVLFLRLTGR
jgi:hypothetical protein